MDGHLTLTPSSREETKKHPAEDLDEKNNILRKHKKANTGLSAPTDFFWEENLANRRTYVRPRACCVL